MIIRCQARLWKAKTLKLLWHYWLSLLPEPLFSLQPSQSGSMHKFTLISLPAHPNAAPDLTNTLYNWERWHLLDLQLKHHTAAKLPCSKLQVEIFQSYFCFCSWTYLQHINKHVPGAKHTPQISRVDNPFLQCPFDIKKTSVTSKAFFCRDVDRPELAWEGNLLNWWEANRLSWLLQINTHIIHNLYSHPAIRAQVRASLWARARSPRHTDPCSWAGENDR